MLVQSCSYFRPVSNLKEFSEDSRYRFWPIEKQEDVLEKPAIKISEELKVSHSLDNCRTARNQKFTNQRQIKDSVKYVDYQKKSNSNITDPEKKLQNEEIQMKKHFRIHMNDNEKIRNSDGYKNKSDISSYSLQESDGVSENCNSAISIQFRTPPNISNTNVSPNDSSTQCPSFPSSSSADNIVQRKSCLDKRRNCTERLVHRVTFDDRNLVGEQNTDCRLQVSFNQPEPSIQEPTLICLEDKLNNQKCTPSTQIQTSYSHQTQRTEEEWDNPFQPEGEVSQDADLMLQLWKDGRHVTMDSLQILDEEIKERDIQASFNEIQILNERLKIEGGHEEQSAVTECSENVVDMELNIQESKNKTSHKITSIVVKNNWITTALIIQRNILALKRRHKKHKSEEKEQCMVM